jgi:agmatine deiminase
MIARFLSADTVFCMTSRAGGQNATVLGSIEQRLRASGMNVVGVPAPALIRGPDGEPLPASYCNFYVANEAVVVPTYGVETDEAALSEIGNAFPGREVVGLPARDLLCGGGAFHCATQAQPSIP